MGIKNAGLREHEKILLDILANNLFNAGRKVNLNEDNLDAVWCEAYAQAVTLMAFHSSENEILKSKKSIYIKKKLNQTLADNTKIDFVYQIIGKNSINEYLNKKKEEYIQKKIYCKGYISNMFTELSAELKNNVKNIQKQLNK